MSKDLFSKTRNLAIVTGGTRGIGKAISIDLQNNGFDVVASYHHDDANANIFAKQHDIKVMRWDVADYNSCVEAVAQIEMDYAKPVSILVNNAGIIRDKMMHRMDIKDWLDVIAVNLSACFNMSRSVINQMRNQNYGKIVNITSVNALTGQLGQTNYCAAKAGIIGLTKALALESANKGITVNCIAPGYIKTDMTDKILQNILDQIVNNTPIKRLGLPEEISRAVLFLVGQNSDFITGETISVNGGYCMH